MTNAQPPEQRAPYADFLLLGGGLASLSAAETLRLEGCKGKITIVCAEAVLPYQRPPLSKIVLLTGSAAGAIPILKESDLSRLGIELLLGTRATAVDPVAKTVATSTAEQIRYGKLLVATGALPIRPGIPGSDLSGIHNLRTIGDALAIHHESIAGKHAVVIGSSFIAMEVSTALHRLGVRVTMLAQQGRVFDTLRSSSISGYFSKLCQESGIEVVNGIPAAFEGSGRVCAVLTKGGHRIPCDFVVVGTGVAPDVDFLQGSGIPVSNGVLVDDRLSSVVPDVFAAGDVAAFHDPVFGLRRRGEHWDNAVKQGRLAAKNMLGQRLPFDEVSSFFCEALGVNFQFLGLPDAAPRRIELGTRTASHWGLLYLRNEVPHALFTTGRGAAETEAIRSLIRHRTHVGRIRRKLKSPGFSIAAIPNQTVLILQGGGALGAFEAARRRVCVQQSVHRDSVFSRCTHGTARGPAVHEAFRRGRMGPTS